MVVGLCRGGGDSGGDSGSGQVTSASRDSTMMPPSVYEFDDVQGTWVQTNGVVAVNGEKLPTAGTQAYNDAAEEAGLPRAPLVPRLSTTNDDTNSDDEGKLLGPLRKGKMKGGRKRPQNLQEESEFKWAQTSMSVEDFRKRFANDPRSVSVSMEARKTGWFNCDSPYNSVLVSGFVGSAPGRSVGSSCVVKSIGVDYSGILSSRCRAPAVAALSHPLLQTTSTATAATTADPSDGGSGGSGVGGDALQGLQYPFTVMAQFDSTIKLGVMCELPGKRAGDAGKAVEAWDKENPLDWNAASKEGREMWSKARARVAEENAAISTTEFGPYETNKKPGTVLDVGVLRLA
mmetsp:Transcript_65992/g.123491  ORF Transcript_65992/g.123491 Transcript_65992/m.123491 type:complete len:346 (-) Transcript_65992:723-1760(-)